MQILLNKENGEGFEIIKRGLAVFDVCETGGGNTNRITQLAKDLKEVREKGICPILLAELAELQILLKQFQLIRPDYKEALADEVDRRLRVFDKYILKREQFNVRVHGTTKLEGTKRCRKKPQKKNAKADRGYWKTRKS